MTDYTLTPGPDKGLLQCQYCGTLHRYGAARKGEVLRCVQCHTTIDRYYADSVDKSLAFSIAALLLVFPANFFPVITLEVWGSVSTNTIWDSIVALGESGMLIIALIVFLASMVIPFIKIVGMIALCITCKSTRLKRYRTKLYKLIDSTGHWSMLDIFLVAILIAVLKLGDLAYAVPGQGLLYFALMVVCTMVASSCFDPKIIWDDDL